MEIKEDIRGIYYTVLNITVQLIRPKSGSKSMQLGDLVVSYL